MDKNLLLVVAAVGVVAVVLLSRRASAAPGGVAAPAEQKRSTTKYDVVLGLADTAAKVADGYFTDRTRKTSGVVGPGIAL